MSDEQITTNPGDINTAPVVVTTQPSQDQKVASNLVTSLIRTYAPILAGLLLTLLAKLKFTFTGDIVPIVTAALSAIYYTIVRLLEHFKSSKFGIFLLRTAKPVYDATVVEVHKAA